MTRPLVPGPRAGLAAGVATLRALGAPLPGLRAVGWRDVVLGTDRADEPVGGRLWLGPRPAPPLLLAIGVTPLGPEDRRVMRLADAMARAGRSVFVPRLELARRRLDPVDRERLVVAIASLRAHPSCRGPVAALGFSFGGSYLLAAAGDPRVRDDLGLVAAFGAYADLLDLFVRQRDRFVELVDVDAAAVRDGLGADLDADALAATTAILRGEGDAADAPAALLELNRRLSPVANAEEVSAPVHLVHAVDDPVIPVSELDRLERAFPRAPSHRVRLFTHVDFKPTPGRLLDAGRDLAVAWRLATALLAVGARG